MAREKLYVQVNASANGKDTNDEELTLYVVAGDYAMHEIIDSRTILLQNVWCAAGFTGRYPVCFLMQPT